MLVTASDAEIFLYFRNTLNFKRFFSFPRDKDLFMELGGF